MLKGNDTCWTTRSVGKDGEHKKMKIIKAPKKIFTMYAYTSVYLNIIKTI